MAPLNKFPFKAMIAIIEFLNTKGNSFSEIYDIQDASKACYSDTTEIMQMLEYLTAFGQVKETSQGWIKVNTQEYISRKLFRDFYLKDAIKVLNLLNDIPQTIGNLVISVDKVNSKETQEYLEFLAKITQYGFVKKNKKDWKLESYSSLPQMEV